MDPKSFNSLNDRQKQTMLLAIEVRNNIENFHSKYLTDEQVAELNPLIRQGIINGIELWEEYNKFSLSKEVKGEITEYMLMAIFMIPDYWELPVENYYKKLIAKKNKNNE